MHVRPWLLRVTKYSWIRRRDWSINASPIRRWDEPVRQELDRFVVVRREVRAGRATVYPFIIWSNSLSITDIASKELKQFVVSFSIFNYFNVQQRWSWVLYYKLFMYLDIISCYSNGSSSPHRNCRTNHSVVEPTCTWSKGPRASKRHLYLFSRYRGDHWCTQQKDTNTH